jgi:S-adenosylmethionine:tRNA ribosyltransferase-isomerase
MDVADFDFELPDELIAQEPPPARGGSRLLVLHRDSGALEFTTFAQLGDHLRAGDLLVLNNTKVFPARLLGVRVPSGGAVECMLLTQLPTPPLPIPNGTGSGVGSLGVG